MIQRSSGCGWGREELVELAGRGEGRNRNLRQPEVVMTVRRLEESQCSCGGEVGSGKEGVEMARVCLWKGKVEGSEGEKVPRVVEQVLHVMRVSIV